jgi:hypothetical protein
MRIERRPFFRAALAALAVAAALPAGAQVPGPEAIEVLRTEDGPRVLLAGVGPGTAWARAAERLGGPGIVAAFFGAGPIFLRGEVGGVRCAMMVSEDLGRVRDLYMECEGDAGALRRLAERYRAALSALPAEELSDGVAFGGERAVAQVGIAPVDDDGWWARLFGPRRLRFEIRG